MPPPELPLLICAATAEELAVFPADAACHRVRIITGVGIPLTLLRLQEALVTIRPRHILNIGIAGAYPDSGLTIGDLVVGESEIFGDLGFELPEPPGFRFVGEAVFGAEYAEPLPLVPLSPFCTNLPTGRGCTVNCCTGTDKTGRWRQARFGAVFETMEGAAVALIGQKQQIPVTQIRAISNIAARRAMLPENIRHALNRLTQHFAEHAGTLTAVP